ncbi:unnamed protein product [Ectocarpus fasciculatus]
MEKGLPLAPGDRIFYWDRTKVVGLASSRREATILEIRSKKAAKEANVELLVLDNHQVVMNDWVIQRYIKDEDTGEMQLGERSSFQSEVQHYKLKRGKLEGVDQRRHERMEALVGGFREGIAEYGAGDQLVRGVDRTKVPNFGPFYRRYDDATSSSLKRNKVAAKKAKSSTSSGEGGRRRCWQRCEWQWWWSSLRGAKGVLRWGKKMMVMRSQRRSPRPGNGRSQRRG